MTANADNGGTDALAAMPQAAAPAVARRDEGSGEPRRPGQRSDLT
jgi:hypothetical protein